MAKTINLLWALPVDTATLSARLEAFLERRAICSTLSICAKKPVSPIPAHLPPTVIEKITSAVTEAAYQSKIRGWMTAVDCIRGDCWHKPKAYYEGSHGINSKDFDGEHSYGCDLNAYGYTVQEVHHRNVGAYLEKIQRFKKRKELLIATFSLSPDFRLLNAARNCNIISNFDRTGYDFQSAIHSSHRVPTAFASYLTLPVDEIRLQHEKGPDRVSYAITHMMAPSSVQPLGEDKMALFCSAVDALKLDRAHSVVMVDDKDEEDSQWSDTESGAETPRDDDDSKDIPRSGEEVKKQHVECLECGTALCKGEQALTKRVPELMLLGWGKLGSYKGY